MIVSTSANGAPARISRRMSSTDWEENRADSFCKSFSLDTSGAGEWVADSISSLFLMPFRKNRSRCLPARPERSVELDENTCQRGMNETCKDCDHGDSSSHGKRCGRRISPETHPAKGFIQQSRTEHAAFGIFAPSRDANCPGRRLTDTEGGSCRWPQKASLGT